MASLANLPAGNQRPRACDIADGLIEDLLSVAGDAGEIAEVAAALRQTCWSLARPGRVPADRHRHVRSAVEVIDKLTAAVNGRK